MYIYVRRDMCLGLLEVYEVIYVYKISTFIYIGV